MRCVWLPRKYECSHMSVLEWNVAQRENTKELHPWFYERSNAQRQHAWVCRRGIRQRNKTDVSGASFCSHVKKRIKKKVLLLLQTNNTPSWVYKGVPQCGSQQCDTLLNQPKLKELTTVSKHPSKNSWGLVLSPAPPLHCHICRMALISSGRKTCFWICFHAYRNIFGLDVHIYLYVGWHLHCMHSFFFLSHKFHRNSIFILWTVAH